MGKEKLNGYWTKKFGGHYVYIERVYKQGYVTGFKYWKNDEGHQIQGQIRLTHDELKENYLKH